MMDTVGRTARAATVARADAYSPFLRSAIEALPTITSTFVENGAEATIAAALLVGDGTAGVLLRQRRRALALAVALGDLSGECNLERVTGALSDFADAALDAALVQAIAERTPDAEPRGLAVLALGKLGSHELNYSSDVDLILIFDPATFPRRERDEAGEAAVRVGKRMIELIQARTADGYVQRIDLRLRPASEVTPIVLPVDAAIAHYESSALPWERAAFIRARACAGDIALGRRFLAEIRPFVWRRALDFGAIDEIRQISLRIRDHYEQGQAFGPGFDLKRGRGGIREVEFFTQVQQLVHGGRDPALQISATMPALAALADAGHLEQAVAGSLATAYRARRTVEHRAQMINDQQTHRLPADLTAFDAIARLDERADADALLVVLAPHVAAVSDQFDRLVGEQGPRLSNDRHLLRRELAKIGFVDVETAAIRITDWRSGRARSLRSPAAINAFEAMLPTLLAAIAQAGDPAHALNRLADIIERVSSGVNLFRLLEARPSSALRLAQILSHAPVLAQQLALRPGLLDGVIDESSFAEPPVPADIATLLTTAIAEEPLDRALESARRIVNERRFAYGVQLIAATRDPLVIGRGYADLAEGAIAALAAVTEAEFSSVHGHVPGGSFVILALGRLGGRLLTNASDLDLIFLFDAPDGAHADGARALPATDYYNRLASRIVAALSVPTAAGPLYEVDTRLRPEGAKGMLAVKVAAFATYQREVAWTWEHMALCRARPVYGSVEAREAVGALIHELLSRPGDPVRIRADSGRMRADMARHKPATGPLDIKLGEGGLVDLEFAVHTLQLTHARGLDPRMEQAITALAAAGLMDGALVADLDLLTRLLVALRLVAPTGEPAPASRQLVADLCSQPDWGKLLEAQLAARQRIALFWREVRQ